MAISVVVPVLNDADALHRLLSCLRKASDGIIGEIVVVDGGSHDGSVQLAEAFGASVHVEAPSRGRQLRTGCERGGGPLAVACCTRTARSRPPTRGLLAG